MKKKLLAYLKTEYNDALLDSNEIKRNKKTLENFSIPENSFIHLLYQNYDIDCFYFEGEVEDGDFLFESLSLIDDLKDSAKYLYDRWLVSKEFLPISDGEAGFYTFYNIKSNKVFFCDINLVKNIPDNAEKLWDSFEEFFYEYMNI